MLTLENGPDKQSILAKIGSVVARSDKIIGRFLALPLNAVIYPMKPSSWSKPWGESCKKGLSHVVGSQGDDDDSFFDRLGISFVKFFTYPAKPSNWSKLSWDWLWHDIKNGGRYIIGMPLEEYDQLAKNVQKGITQASKNLGVEVKLVDYENGKMIFEASRVLGDVSRLTSKQLDQIKKALPNVTVDKGRNKISIEVDAVAIINDIKADPANKGKSEREIIKLAAARIDEEVLSILEKFGKITGGEFEYHRDRKLSRAIAEALIRGSVSKEKPVEKPAEAVKPLEKPVQGPSETETLRSDDMSETLRRLFDDGSFQKIAEPLVNSGKRKRGSSEMESLEDDGQLHKKQKVESQEVTNELLVGSSMEAAQKAARAAIKAKRQEQSAQNTGIDSKGLGQIFQSRRHLTGGCGVQADSTWRERQEQQIESQDSKEQKGFSRY